MARDPYRYFRVEARELVEQLGTGALDLERGTSTADLIPRLLRLTHTLKGAARVVKQREIADRAHAIEDALAPFRAFDVAVPGETIERVLGLIDEITAAVAALPLPAAPDVAAVERASAEGQFQTVRADISEMDALLDGISETASRLQALRRGLGTVGQIRALVDDGLLDLVSGLERSMSASLDQMDRELSQVRSTAEQMRLVPAHMLFASLERLVRDTAQTSGKGVAFEGRGGEVRLDAHVLTAVQSALIQITRNAVVHGIESSSVRTAAGKSADGHITLTVARRGRRVVFSCADDGQGIDLDAVRRAAERKGVPAAHVDALDEGALLRLLFSGGLSTSSAVTEASGRGIGLDLVREAVERLGGETSVRTAAGQGTTIDLEVPLSIASIEAIVVEASGMTVSIPLDAVRRTMWVGADAVVRSAQGDSVLYHDSVIPLVPLSRLVRANSADGGRPFWSTVIVEGVGGAVAVGVDRIVGAATIVFRALPELAPSPPIVAGASLDAEGNPQLVLDADSIVAQARTVQRATADAAPRRLPILIIDDSLTTRMLEQSILESAGFEVGVAASAEEGFEQAQRRPYGLFLVDVEMPGMDGFTFIERIRADAALRDIPAILITSRDHADDRRRGMVVGAQGYIVKGAFDQTVFLQQIRALIG